MALAPHRFIIASGVFSAGVAVFVAITARETGRLRVQAAHLSARAGELAASQPERDIPAPTAHDANRETQVALETARAELESLRINYQTAAISALQRKPDIRNLPTTPPGQATQEAAVQSVIQAIIAGDTEGLVDLISFDQEARDQAEAFWSELPPDLRSQFNTATELVAHVMVAKTSMNLTEATAEQLDWDGSDTAKLRMRLVDSNGHSRTATFHLQRDTAGWRLSVPAKIIEGYRALVTGVSPASIQTAASR